jgi:hypothetical protein
MSKLEVFLLIVALANVVVVLEFVRRRKLLESYALLWLLVGFGGIFFAVGRSLFDSTARAVGISNGANLILAAGVLFLLFVCMSLSLHVSRLEARSEVLAEEVAFLRTDRPSPPRVTDPLAEPAEGDVVEPPGPQR